MFRSSVLRFIFGFLVVAVLVVAVLVVAGEARGQSCYGGNGGGFSAQYGANPYGYVPQGTGGFQGFNPLAASYSGNGGGSPYVQGQFRGGFDVPTSPYLQPQQFAPQQAQWEFDRGRGRYVPSWYPYPSPSGFVCPPGYRCFPIYR